MILGRDSLGWTSLAIVLLLTGMITAPAVAQQAQQQAPPQQTPPAQQAPPVNVDQQTLEAAAKAYLDIQEIRDEFLPQIEGATDQNQAQQLQQQANERMVAAIEDNDLELDEYNEIIQAITQNDQLRSQFLGLVEQEQEDREG